MNGESNTSKSWLSRLRRGLRSSSTRLSEGIVGIFTGRKLDAAALEELEDLLITGDLGVETASRLTAAVSKTRFNQQVSADAIRETLAAEIVTILAPVAIPLVANPAHHPHVLLVAGVNGSGKTTTIGKLAKRFREDGKSVMLAAGDTFRAAAIDQLVIWGKRVGAEVIARPAGSDAASLAFEAIDAARESNTEVLIIDTAGRLQNRKDLMEQLSKMVRVIRKQDSSAPHDSVLVLDACIGQNAVNQVRTFREFCDISGLVITKLDGSARGGVLVSLAQQFGLPVHAVGVGEGEDDLHPFDARMFAHTLVGLPTDDANS